MNIEIYCDESRQDLFNNKDAIRENNKFICIGGIWVNKDIRNQLKEDIKKLQKKYNTFGEIKWKNVCNTRFDFYKAIIELFFSYDNALRFRCLVVDASKVDLDTYHDSDAELGFYKFYYQLVNCWVSYPNEYAIFTDFKRNRANDRLIVLKRVLNNSRGNVVRSIQAINSKESLILQLEDVLMGAVGYKFNFVDNGASKPKTDLIKYFEQRNGNAIGATSLSAQKVNIFEISLGNNGGSL